nr:FAD binding domain-containing protein [Ktedonobacteraceae bacterium]
MLLNLLEYAWAEQLDEALMLLSRTDMKTVPLAGGTYLLGQTDDSIQAVVDLRDLELAYITEDAHGVHIGAMSTLQSMVDAPVLQELASGILSRAALASSFSRLIRNGATLGGTLGAGVASQADLLTALAVLDAEVVVRSGSKTQVNLSGGTLEHPGLALSGVTYKGKQERHIPFSGIFSERRPNELILEVIVPRLAHSGAAFTRVGRTPTDVALLNAAAVVQVTDGVFSQVRVALGGVNMEPVRLLATERQLEGQPVSNAGDAQLLVTAVNAGIAEFQPPSDFRASSGYRRACGTNLALRVLEAAMNISRGYNAVSPEGSK